MWVAENDCFTTWVLAGSWLGSRGRPWVQVLRYAKWVSQEVAYLYNTHAKFILDTHYQARTWKLFSNYWCLAPTLTTDLRIIVYAVKGGGKHTFTFSLFTTQSFIIYLTNIKHLLNSSFWLQNKQRARACHWKSLNTPLVKYCVLYTQDLVNWLPQKERCVRPGATVLPREMKDRIREGTQGTEPCTAAFRVSLHFVFYLSFCLKDYG